MTGIEKVARAICCPGGICRAGFQNARDAGKYVTKNVCMAPMVMDTARLVLLEIREPSEKVKAAITVAAWRSGSGVDPATVFHAAIDVLLNEKAP